MGGGSGIVQLETEKEGSLTSKSGRRTNIWQVWVWVEGPEQIPLPHLLTILTPL